MCKYVLPFFLAASCASLALPASAQTLWNFSYTGFLIQDSGRFQPDLRFDGAFRGRDANGDGALERNELDAFWWNGYSYFENPRSGCNGASCALTDFRYDLGTGQLSFDAKWSYADEASVSSMRTSTGQRIVFSGETGYRPPFFSYSTVYLWTDQTRFAISPPPVDEPPAVALLPAGLLLFAALKRRPG